MTRREWIDSTLQGVSHIPSSRRVKLTGSGERLHTWHTFESRGYEAWSAARGARYLIQQANEAHFVLHPTSGELVQLLPLSSGARTLRAPSGILTNRHGSVHVQTEVIGDAARPFTADLTPAGRRALGYLMDFLRAAGIPDSWAGGIRPPDYPGRGVSRFMPRAGASGHTHHAAWRGNDHGDPGAISDPWSIVPVVSEAPTSSPGGTDSLGRYTVRPGDTLSVLAARFRTSVGALQLLNGIHNPDRIRAGQQLFTRWVVSRGDTLGAIAKRAGTTPERLAALNGIRDPNLIRVGQLLRLP